MDGRRGGREREDMFHKLDMTRNKDFFQVRVKIEKGPLSEGVIEKDNKDGIWDRVCEKNRNTTRENIDTQRHKVWMS